MPNITSPFYVDQYGSRPQLWSHDANVLRILQHELPADRTELRGVELELDWRRKRKAQKALHEAFGELPCFICKHDGSICGAEIVTLPMNREEQQTFIECLQDNMALANLQATRRDGIHIHVDRAQFSDLDIKKMLIILHKRSMQPLIDAFARRRANSFCRRSGYVNEGDLATFVNRVMHNENKYEALNCSREDTLEFRLFKATTSTAAFMRCIEVVDLIIAYAQVDNCPIEDFIEQCTSQHLLAFIDSHSRQFPLLHRWIHTSNKFTNWVSGRHAEARVVRSNYLSTRLMGQTPTPTHGEVLATWRRVQETYNSQEMAQVDRNPDLARDEFCGWYAEQCGGSFTSMRGHVRTGSRLRWQAMYHLRLARRLEHRTWRAAIINGTAPMDPRAEAALATIVVNDEEAPWIAPPGTNGTVADVFARQEAMLNEQFAAQLQGAL